MQIKVNCDLEVVARVAYEAVREVDWILSDAAPVAWEDLDVVATDRIFLGVKFILAHPTASEKDWHDAWRARNRDVASAAELEEYENLDPIYRLKIRLWRHIVHAFIE